METCKLSKDELMLIAHFKVYGLNIYGSTYQNIASGKNNMASYFMAKKAWTMYRIRKTLKRLRDKGLIFSVKSEVGGLYKLSTFI